MNSEADKAMSYASRVLTYRQRTTRELTKKLEEHGFSAEATRSVMDTMVKYGYIDDKAYTRQWIEQRLYKRGFAGLKRELQQKGVDPVIIEETIAQAGPEVEFQAALQLAIKKFTPCGSNYSFSKLARFLQNRGYSYETISKVGRTIAENMAKP